jgi:hypothetical protein
MACGAAKFRVIRPRQRMQRGQISTLGRSNSFAGAKMYPCHPRPLCDHRRPCWQRSGSRPATAATSAAVALGGEAPHAGRQGAPRLRRAAGHARCRAALPAPRRARRPAEPGGLDAAACGVEALRCPAVARQPPRGFAAPGASASARLAPWKGHRRCTLDPAPSAGIGKSSRDTKHHGALSQAPQFCSQALSERLRSRLDPLDRE